ncbi:MAG: hypothetical protein EU551_02390 [Promethearchaeota archaeon]|nr:MAG: hypothetical protein EU551_02390 [Candidatus Lokiarchaeota archaeon]
MVSDSEIKEVEDLIRNQKLEAGFTRVQELISEQVKSILNMPEGSQRSYDYRELESKYVVGPYIVIPEAKHYVRNISLPLGLAGIAGLLLMLLTIPTNSFAFLMIGIIIMLIGYVGFVISLPICIALNVTGKLKKPESWILRISKTQVRIDMQKDLLTEYQKERLRLDILRYLWAWIVSAKKFGYVESARFG